MLDDKASARTELPSVETVTSALRDVIPVIDLVDYSPPKILLDTLFTVKEELVALGIFVKDYQIEQPTFFLESPLTQEQRKLLDTQLGPIYAQESVELQGYLEKIRIVESNEGLTSLKALYEAGSIPATFSTLPFNDACGDWAGKQRVFWVRNSIAKRLGKLSLALEKADLMLHFEDAFRPVGVQEGLFKRRIKWVMDEHPDWTLDEILLEAKSKTAITPRLASHKSGAAVDVVLKKLSTGELLELGNKYPEGGAVVALKCPFVTEQQWITRQLFAGIFTMAGFAIYPGEDWHVSYGDNLDRGIGFEFLADYITPAKYGPIKSFEDGNITEVYSVTEYDEPFLDEELKAALAQRENK